MDFLRYTPAALAGIAWFLFITHTTLSVPALMGAIMCMGVATSNSILVVSFATEKMEQGSDSIGAALEAGFTRFRPVLMTALAMIIGMVPMALGMGDGGEQNAPLGRAVIGGLLFATVSTLFFVPAFFSLLQGSRKQVARKRQNQRTKQNSCGVTMSQQTEEKKQIGGQSELSERCGGLKAAPVKTMVGVWRLRWWSSPLLLVTGILSRSQGAHKS